MLMDHTNGPNSKPKKASERFARAIRATTPSRTTRFNPHHHRNDAAIVSITAPNVSLLVPPPKGDFCLRVTPSNHNEGQQSVSVPIIFDATHSSNDGDVQKVGSVQPYGQGAYGAMSLNGVFSEYIDRAGEKIRSPTIISDPKASMKYDSFNAKVSEYIDQTRHRFHMPSSLGVSEIV